MSDPLPSAFHEQGEEFARRIEALARQQQEVLYALCVQRMARDSGVLSAAPRRSRPLQRLTKWLTARRDKVQALAENEAQGNTVIVIDSTTAVVTEEGER